MRRFSLAAMGRSTPVSSTVFTVDENCEGVGTPAGWTNLTGSPNWDYTTTPLAGSESLYLSLNGAAHRAVYDFTNTSEVWVYCLMRATNGTHPAATINCLGAGVNGGATAYGCSLSATLQLAAGTSVFTTDVLSLNTTYHIWAHFKKGTGANSVIDVAFSTNGVRPTSGTAYAEITNGALTTNIGRLFIGTGSTSMGMDIIYDNIRLALTQIGDNGT